MIEKETHLMETSGVIERLLKTYIKPCRRSTARFGLLLGAFNMHIQTLLNEDIEDSSWVRVRDKDIFSRRVTGRPSDEGARSVRNTLMSVSTLLTFKTFPFYLGSED